MVCVGLCMHATSHFLYRLAVVHCDSLLWLSTQLVLPNPQIHTFEVPAGATYRVCLASDGLWDICSFADAASEMRYHGTCKSAATRLLGMAKNEYLGVRGHEAMDDDTTIMVIELNPMGVAHVGEASAGCCSVL